MDSHVSWLLHAHITLAQCHLQSGSLPRRGMGHFANARMHTLHFKLWRGESLKNASNSCSLKTPQTWSLSPAIQEYT